MSVEHAGIEARGYLIGMCGDNRCSCLHYAERLRRQQGRAGSIGEAGHGFSVPGSQTATGVPRSSSMA
jgi:hypothetical protein